MTGVTGADMGVFAAPHICNRSPAGGAAGGCGTKSTHARKIPRIEVALL